MRAALACFVALGLGPLAAADPQPPLDLVFKIHIEPQADDRGNPPLAQRRDAYRLRRDDVEAVRRIAEAHGARLSIHGNGEFWEFAKEEGDAGRVRGWIAASHHVGVHMHSVYRRGAHDWPDLPASQQTADRVRSAWQDHTDALRALLPELQIEGATPFNFQGEGFDALMQAFGFSVLGGGRHEVAASWLGHGPFNPWRPGARDLEEDLANRDFLIAFHSPQITKAATHGPDRVFQDQTVAHLQVELLQALLERARHERTGGVEKRWLFGILTHDNQSGPDVRAEIDRFLTWADGFVAAGLVRYASFDEVKASFEEWEARHPGVSSFHFQEGDPYPYSFPALAEELRVSERVAVGLVGPATLGAGATGYELARGPRSGGTREALLLAWREAGTASVDVSAVLGPGTVQVLDAAAGGWTSVPASAVPIGPDPVLVRR